MIPYVTPPSIPSSISPTLNQPKHQSGAISSPLTLAHTLHLHSPVDQPSSTTIMRSLNADKNKKRTPARAQKLIADIHLLAGRADIALGMYATCIESMKTSGDHLWHAAALEGHHCAILTLTLRKCGVLAS